MKRIIQINSVPYGSTGKIMFFLSKMLSDKNYDSICVTGFSWYKTNQANHGIVGNILTKSFHMFMSKMFGNHGCYSAWATKSFIKKVKKYSPDIIHLHNIHGWYLNIPILFDYIKKTNCRVIWTLHDCWAFTGGCAHFTFAHCNKWTEACGGCNNLEAYPISSKRDRTKEMFLMKKKCFSGVENLTIVTPSEWLADLVRQSFLKDYPVKVINNGIDLAIFRPAPSDFREKLSISKDKKVLLGVAFDWGVRKGLDVFIELAQRLDKNRYQIVLVGTDDRIDKQLPENIISIHRTQDQNELAEIYSAADVFVNPTREENFPTVNIESLACGTPIVTFATGGSPEILDETCGSVVPCDDVNSLEKEICRICEEKPYSSEACVTRAKRYEKNAAFSEYIRLYNEVLND